MPSSSFAGNWRNQRCSDRSSKGSGTGKLQQNLPSVSAARIAMVLKAMAVPGRPWIRSDRCYPHRYFPTICCFGSTRSSFPSPVQSQTVQSTSDLNAGPCPTCLHIYCDNVDIEQLWDNKPSSTLPLKISYAAPYMYSKPTPTPPPTAREATTAPTSSFISMFVTPPHGASLRSPLRLYGTGTCSDTYPSQWFEERTYSATPR